MQLRRGAGGDAGTAGQLEQPRVGVADHLANDDLHALELARRAVANLLTATRNRAEANGFTDDKALEIAAILDEAASRIERL